MNRVMQRIFRNKPALALWLCAAAFLLMLVPWSGGERGAAQAASPTLDEILAMTPAGCPDPMLRRDTPMDVGQKMVEPRKRSHRVVVTAPGVLDKDDTEYVLESDIHAPGTGFSIKGRRITLNLNGHTVFYNEKEDGYGVALDTWWQNDVEVINGTIEQGAANGHGNQNGIGCNPVHTLSGKGNRLAGLHIVWSGDDIDGMYIQYHDGLEVVYNTLTDKGSGLTNRHQGLDALRVNGGTKVVVRHNLIERARHHGIAIATTDPVVEGNEVHVDSVGTNSIGVYAGSGVIRGNKIFGKGTHPIGIWPGRGVKVVGNYVEVQNTTQSPEYKDPGSAGLRMTWGTNEDVEAWANIFYVRGKRDGVSPGENSWGRSLFVGLTKPGQKALFHHNIIVAASPGDGSKAAAVAMVCNNNTSGFVFENNIIASDWGPILLADSYGFSDGFPVFRHNRIIKIDDGSPSFFTIRTEDGSIPSTATLISNTFEGGARPDDIDFRLPATALKELRFGWTVTLTVRDASGAPVPGARITATNSAMDAPVEGTTDAKGTASLDLVVRRLTNEKNGSFWTGRDLKDIPLTPYSVRVEAGGKTKTLTLSPTQDESVDVRL
ncbi:hypothetical protein dsx2_1179 [Desulfovibrio sp. X2]|uniref:right-handed parallel beta-helix repeat-containing protein n=1 Tax=Desulfovibrio sp. X2 TaxID=941449 RepID=UPI00035882AF|nr:carboxypeptidase regulatory-like domain-containing protein [Desulfovibrio sp. X2]EPR37236.1 hypothetical protein dsx2_1179 [Desulfovibrio sp. X2]